MLARLVLAALFAATLTAAPLEYRACGGNNQPACTVAPGFTLARPNAEQSAALAASFLAIGVYNWWVSDTAGDWVVGTYNSQIPFVWHAGEFVRRSGPTIFWYDVDENGVAVGAGAMGGLPYGPNSATLPSPEWFQPFLLHTEGWTGLPMGSSGWQGFETMTHAEWMGRDQAGNLLGMWVNQAGIEQQFELVNTGSAVPEPGTWALLSVSLAALLVRRRMQ